MSEKTMSNETMSIDSTSKDLSISISSGGSKATGNKGRQNNLDKEILVKEETEILTNLQKTSY